MALRFIWLFCLIFQTAIFALNTKQNYSENTQMGSKDTKYYDDNVNKSNPWFEWNSWASWTGCTKTCGIGIQLRQRLCFDSRSSIRVNETYCFGASKEYKTCNRHLCPYEATDVRSTQCEHLGNKQAFPFNLYRWTAYYNVSASWFAENPPCSLVCQTEDRHTPLVRQLATEVADGTPCAGSLNSLCISGQCVPVDCYGSLNSLISIDECGICGGNGSTCQRKRGTFDRIQRAGLHKVVSFEEGAADIRVRHETEDSGHLVLRDKYAGFLFNGPYFPSTPLGEEHRINNLTFYLQRFPLDETAVLFSPERLNHAVDLMVFVRKNNSHIRIEYDFTVPLQKQKNTEQRQTNLHPFLVSVDFKDNAKAKTKVRSEEEKVNNENTAESPTESGFISKITNDKNVTAEAKIAVAGNELARSTARTIGRPSVKIEFRIVSEDDTTPSGVDLAKQSSVVTDATTPASEVDRQSMTLTTWLPQFPVLHFLHGHPERELKLDVGYDDEDMYDFDFTDQTVEAFRGESSARNDSGISYDAVSRGILKNNSDEDMKHLKANISQKEVEYRWQFVGPIYCSSTCTPGLSYPAYQCQRIVDKQMVEDKLCDHLPKAKPKPEFCAGRECNARWVTGIWSDCSVSCSQGQQVRGVRCWKVLAPGFDSSVHDYACDDQPKPLSVRPCVMTACGPQWSVSEWSQCSVPCGYGIQTRNVLCAPSTLACNETQRPPDTRTCYTKPCITFWRTTNWSNCSGPCGSGVRERNIECRHPNGSRLDEVHCTGLKRPVHREPCATDRVNCPPQWMPQTWNKCSAKCGGANQSREVLCSGVKESRARLYREKRCRHLPRPDKVRPCLVIPCQPQWFTTQWSKCSATCGTGYKVRDVQCYHNGVVSTDCPLTERPVNKEFCNQEMCPSAVTEKTVLQQGFPCEDQPESDCDEVLKQKLCHHPYYKKVCCKSCS